MAAAGTLLSDLDGTGGADGDLVQKILSDMNIPSNSGARPVPPPMPQQQQAPQQTYHPASSTQNMTMDSQVPMSHMIGNEHPTPADFAAAMVGVASSRPDVATMSASYDAAPMPGFASEGPAEPATKNIHSRIVSEIKLPALVAILFFVFSLPPIRVLVSHYMRTLIKPTGELNLLGLMFVSGMVGAVFWILQRVIAPLLSL